MNCKSAILRVLYFADRDKVDTKQRLNGILYILNDDTDVNISFSKNTNSVGVTLSSDQVEDAINDLQRHGIVKVDESTSIGGNKRQAYMLTSKGVDKAEMLISDKEIDKSIENICSEYVDYPVSNLLDMIRNSEPAHQWV